MGALDIQTADYKAFAQRLKAADRKIASSLRAHVRDAGRPLAEGVVQDGPEGLPERGGLADTLRAAKGGLSMTQTRLTVRITGGVGLRTGKASDLSAINRGRLRHPVFARSGRKAGWANQLVAVGTYDAAIEKHAEYALEDVQRVVVDIMEEL